MMLCRKYILFPVVMTVTILAFISVGIAQSINIYTVTKITDPDPFADPYNFNDALCDPDMLGTLQWAIRKAIDPQSVGASIIEFNIPCPSPPCTSYIITLNQNLPVISSSSPLQPTIQLVNQRPVTIDGTTQNEYTQGTDPVIIIDGKNDQNIDYAFAIGSALLLKLYDVSGSQIKGLTIRNFYHGGVLVGATDCIIESNVFQNIGNTSSYSAAIAILESDHIIRNNIIGANTAGTAFPCYGFGIYIQGLSIGGFNPYDCTNLFDQNNALVQLGQSILNLKCSMGNGNKIGGSAAGEPNIIVNCSEAGIGIRGFRVNIGSFQAPFSGSANLISRNKIFDNGFAPLFTNGKGIELFYLGNWGNGRKQPPIITCGVYGTGSAGVVGTSPGANDIIEVFFSNAVHSATQYIGTTQAVNGVWCLKGVTINQGDYVIATATQGNSTSEFSNRFHVNALCPCAQFTPSSEISCNNGEFSFGDCSIIPSTATFTWDFGDGTTIGPGNGAISGSTNTLGTFEEPVHTYASAGQYTVTLTLTGTGSCTPSTFSYTVTVVSPVTTFTVTNPVAGEVTQFTSVAQTGAIYSWNFGDGGISSLANPTHTYANPGNYTVTLTVTIILQTSTGDYVTCTNTTSQVIHIETCCGVEVPVIGLGTNGNTFSDVGEFFVDGNTGQILYKQSGCNGVFGFDCFLVGPEDPGVTIVTASGVVSAGAVTFFDEWEYDASLYPSANSLLTPDLYETGTRGKWRPESQFVFREPVSKDKNYNSGIFTLTVFDWSNDINGNKGSNDVNQWVITSKTLKYTPNGEPIEDENILGVRSTAKYGYNNTLPVLVAQNAADHAVTYESFENLYGISPNYFFEDRLQYNSSVGQRVKLGQTINSMIAPVHTGQYSIAIDPANFNGGGITLGAVKLVAQTVSEGLLVRIWAHVNKNKTALDPSGDFPSGRINIAYGINSFTNTKYMYPVSAAGEWSLYEAIIAPGELAGIISGVNPFDPEQDFLDIVLLINGSGNNQQQTYLLGDVFIDDIRVQPLQSEMVCYVYDQAQRLTAVLDDQHYAMIYEYNSEGILIRKLKETTEGVKTISETQYNTRGINR